MKHFQIIDYAMQIHPNGNTRLFISGETAYHKILRDAFPSYHFGPTWEAWDSRYDWGAFINDIGEVERSNVSRLLELMKKVVCIDDALNQTFALDYHMQYQGRTELGELVYKAKYLDSPKAQDALTEHFRQFIVSHPSYARSDFLVTIPSFGYSKSSFMSYIVENLCSQLRIANGKDYVNKVRKTEPMKDLGSREDKYNNIRGAFEIVDIAHIQGKSITIIDDLYHSGGTLHELGTTLQRAGTQVQGLTATKTFRDV
jgi:competence protein ComFC